MVAASTSSKPDRRARRRGRRVRARARRRWHRSRSGRWRRTPRPAGRCGRRGSDASPRVRRAGSSHRVTISAGSIVAAGLGHGAREAGDTRTARVAPGPGSSRSRRGRRAMRWRGQPAGADLVVGGHHVDRGWSRRRRRRRPACPSLPVLSAAAEAESTEASTMPSAPRSNTSSRNFALAVGQAVGVADVRAVARSVERVGETAGQHAVEGVGDVGHDHGDHVRTSGAQVPSDGVRAVAKIADRLVHGALGRLADEPLARQDVRDRRRADPGARGDLAIVTRAVGRGWRCRPGHAGHRSLRGHASACLCDPSELARATRGVDPAERAFVS